MSRFVRASKYRHVFGQPGKKEYGIENLKVTNSAWDTNYIAASAEYLSINWNASGGGAFAILPLPSPFAPLPHSFPSKIPDVIPLARGHTAPVLDTDWSPFDDALVASAGEDGKALLWKVESSAFEGWGAEHWEPSDFEPVLRIDVTPRRVGQVVWHPTAQHVLATTTGEHTVKLWDLGSPESAKSVLGGHGDAIQSIAFNPTGNLLVSTSRDRKIRLFDPRAGGDAVRITEGHSGVKGARVVWLGPHDRIATTGFSKMSDRQVSLWDTSSLSNVKTTTIDQSSGVLMPFWSDNNILFLAGKGDGNIRYYEYDADTLHPLAEHKSTEPQRGLTFLPRRALNVQECEIARAYKIYGHTVESIAFIVPRKSDSFQSDIYPPAPSSEPALTAGEFFSGKTAPPKLVSLEDGAISSGQAPSAIPTPAPTAAVSAPVSASVSTTSLPTPTRTSTAPVPVPAAPVSAATPEPVASPKAPEPTSALSRSGSLAFEDTFTPPPSSPPSDLPPPQPPVITASDNQLGALRVENEKLSGELREAREKIRGLELAVETYKANARKAAALLDGA
ncbi:microtubule binding protein [Irpex lacteus]|nr:microtubule binding protein [Irpex lacteus]